MYKTQIKSKFNQIVNKLNHLDEIMNTNPRDSHNFMKANKQSNDLIFDKLTPQEYGLIVERIGRKLTNKDFAKIILVCRKNNTSLKTILKAIQNDIFY